MAKSKRHSQNRNRTKKTGSRKTTAPLNEPVASSINSGDENNSLLQILLTICSGLLLGRMLIPAESSHQGDTILFVFFWLLLFSVTCWIGMRNRIKAVISIDLIDISLFLLAFVGPLLSWTALYARGGNLRTGLYSLWEWIGTFFTVFIIRKLLQKRPSMLPALLLLGIVIPVSGLGIYQHYVSYPQKRELVNPIAKRWEKLEQQISEASENAKIRLQRKQLKLQKEMTDHGIPLDAKIRKGLLNRLNNSSEPTARFALANTLGGILAFAIVLMMSLLLKMLKQKQVPGKIILAGLMMLPVLFCLLLTKSRTALLGMIAGILLLLLHTLFHSAHIKRKHILSALITLVLLLLLILIAIFTGGLDIEVLTEAGKSLRYRLEYWIASWSMLYGKHFLFGAGPGNFRESYLEFKLPESSEVILDPHNLWLDAWSQGGVISLIGLLIVTFFLLKNLIRFCLSNSSKVLSFPGSPEVQHESMPSSRQIAAGAILVILFSGILCSPEIALPIEELIGWGILIAAFASLWRWILKPVTLGPVGLLCAATALFLHLHGAGGYSMPVIIQLLLLFASVCIASPIMFKLHGRLLFPCGIGLGVILTALCWWSAVAPKFAEGVAKAGLYESRSQNESERILQQWTSQDSLNPQPWSMLEGLYEQSALKTRNVQQLEQACNAVMEYIRRDPVNYHGYREQARLSKLLFEWTQDHKRLEQAIRFQQQAISRYPNDSHLHLELAQMYSSLGEKAKMLTAAQRAGELNEINKKHGHTDRIFSEQEQAVLLKLTLSVDEKSNNSD